MEAQRLSLRFRVHGLGIGVEGRLRGLGVSGLGCRVQGIGFKCNIEDEKAWDVRYRV
jgi:glucose-6-phosphate-specific signal transduction histidine kinase